MSNLNASQILECALKDVDKILKVNGEDSNEGQLIGNNHIDQQNLQSTSSPNSDISLVNDIVKNSGEFCNGNYLYRTGKEFSVLIDRLQNCIDKLNSSQAIVLNHSSRRHDLDRRAQRDNRVRMVRPVTTQINEYNLNTIDETYLPPPCLRSPNDCNNLNDETFHQRIVRLQAQIQAQAYRIAELERSGNELPNVTSRINQLPMNMDNVKLLTEVTNQHLRISSLEETNRDLEEKINKLEQELSQRQVNGNLKNPYEDVQNFGFSRQHFPQAPTSWRAATTADNMNQPNGLSRQTNSTNKINYSSFRRSVTPVAFNDNLFSMTFQPEFSPNFVCQSLTGTQSTPPTSRLLYYTPPRHEIYFQNESVNHNLPPNRQNHLSIKANQLKSASFSELRHSRMVRADNNCLKLPANVVQDAQNNLCAKSSAVSGQNYHFFENFYANTKTSAMHNICQLPPQYASSYHQRTYTTPCTRSTLPQLYAQGNDFVNGKLSSINCWSNERVNLFNPLAFCGSPISTRCSDAQNVYSNANRGQLLSSNVSFRQQFNEISQNSGSFSEDEKANIHPKSSVGITAGGPNRIKRLFSDQHFHWLSHGQMNSSSSAGLVKSYSVNRPQNCLTSSLSYTRSKSMERYGVSMRISNSQLYTTQGNCISSSSNFINTTSTTAYKPENINNISSNLMLNSSSVNMPNQSLNDTPQQLCYESIPESSGTYTVNSNVVANPHITNESSTNVRSLFNVSGVCENERPLLPSTYLGLNKIISHLDNDNRKSSSPDTGPNSSSEQRQSFQFAYTKRNFFSWDKNMISAWLYKIGLGYTVSNTRKWLTSGQDLVNTSKKSLTQLMGIRNPLHLKKLSIHIYLRIKDKCPNSYGYLYRNIEPPDNFDMTGWLHDMGLSHYIPQFDSCIVDPYMLDQLTMDDLFVLKMSNELHVLSLRWGLQMLRHIKFDRNRLCRDHMQQCEANIPVNRNLMHSMLPSFSSTQDVIKSTNGYNEMVNYCTVDSDIPRFNSSRPNSINPDTEVFFSTYLPIQICYWTHQRVLDWLQSIELPEYAPKLFGSGVHGALMILEDRFTPDLLADILQISPVKSLVRRHLTNKFIELVGPDIWRRKQQSEITNPLTLHSKIKPTKKKSLFHSNRGYKGNNDSDELVCPIEIDPNHMSIFAEEIVLNCESNFIQQPELDSTLASDTITTNVQRLELQETDL